MKFDYNYQEQPLDSIDIDDIGNVCLHALNDIGEEYFLYIVTDLGWVKAVQFGPTKDISFPLYSSVIYNNFEYNENKLYKLVMQFLNKSGRNITQVFEVDYQVMKDAIDKFCRDVI